MPKPKQKKPSLHQLACELAKLDAGTGFNADVVSVETALWALGEKLRASTTAEAMQILNAIVGGKA